MAKILVADDNSNIQKMVGLALKDHGIEVVAVGNGEAAVRKVSDVRPDLVLADVFMPVRNGYEVCKYVKENKDLAHIPVILLVGAFDPLDEQEAQKAGADGVLKKPFVPPDPLISMVKSALVRAGVPHAGFNPIKEAEAPAAAPEVAVAPPKPTAPKVPVPEFSTESFVEEVPARPAEVKIASGEQHVAFGSLLGTEEEPPELAAPKGMGIERDWRSTKAEEEEEEGEEPSGTGSWRRDGGDEAYDEEATQVAEGHDFRGGGHHEPWMPTREKEDLTEAPELVESMPAAMMDRRDMAAVPFAGEAWAAAITDHKTAVAEAEHPAVHAAELEKLVSEVTQPVVAEPAVVEKRAVVEEAALVAEPAVVAEPQREPGPQAEPKLATMRESAPAPEPPAILQAAPTVVVEESPAVPETPPASTASSWFSPPPPNPWESEAQKASQLASGWDTMPAHESGAAVRGDVSFEATGAPDEIEVVSEGSSVSEVSNVAAETVREEAAQIVEQSEHAGDAPPATGEARDAVYDASANLDMDAVVAKVLARLSPSLLHDATRELLKPVIEAVIREELNSKKS